MMTIVESERLVLRRFIPDDAAFILELVNEPSWIRFIGDKKIRTLEDARNYLINGPMAMYERVGFGLYMVELKEGGVPAGMCGLIKRDTLEDVDIGFAFLPRFWGKGYAHEAAVATMAYGSNALKLKRIVAITSPDNDSSIRLLEKIGLKYVETRKLTADGGESKVFAYPA